MKRWIKALTTIWLTFSLLSPTVVFGQTLKPAYLAEMPPPARVLSEIKGKDAEDTIERQMGAFQALIKIIEDMAWGLEKRYTYQNATDATPDESRIKLAYGYAYADLWHKATRKEEHLYDHDRVLLGELLTKLFSQSFRDVYAKSDAKAAEYYKAYRDKNSGVVFTVGGPAAPKDEFHEACAAKGMDDFTCLMSQMMKGMMNVTGVTSGPVEPGLRMSGGYKNGNLSMRLDPEGTARVWCGDVVLLSSYQVEVKNNQIGFRIINAQDPFSFALKPDGTTLAGPASVSIHGYAPGGSTTTTTPGSTREVQKTTTTEMTATELQASGRAQGATQTGNQTYAVTDTTTATEYTPGTTTVTPAYHAKTVQCRFGVIPVIPESTQPTKTPDFIDRIMPPSGNVPNGLRMAGTYYGEGGASIEFLPDKAIVGCHATIAERPYVLSFKNSQLLVNLGGTGGSQSFTLTPEGTLVGDNARVSLSGRRKTGENTLGDPVYAPSSDTCSYGVLSPRRANPSSAALTPSAVTSAAPQRTDTNISRPSQNSNTTGNTGALSIVTFAGQSSNPLAGGSLFFLKDSAEDVLRKDGFGNATGKSALASWAEACKTGSQDCAKGRMAIQRARVNTARLDANGRVGFANVPLGVYWVVTEIRRDNMTYVWNLRIEVRPGSNNASLDQNNPAIVF